MKLIRLLFCVSVLAICPLLSSCKKPARPVDATQSLTQSFQAAQPDVKQTVGDVNNNLKTGNYLQAARAMEPILESRTLTAQQKEAIGLTLQQIKQAIDANPALESKELYELRAKMFRAATSSRF